MADALDALGEVVVRVESLGRPLCKPFWPLIAVTVAAASAANLRGAAVRRGKGSGAAAAARKGSRLYASIAWTAGVAFVRELLWCVAAAVVAASPLRRRPNVALERTVAFYCGFGFIPGERAAWDGAALRAGIGGSEQCAIRLARALAGRGKSVVVFGGRAAAGATVDGVRYEPCRAFDPCGAYGSVIVWRLPQFLVVQRVLRFFRRRKAAERTTYWIHDGAYLALLDRVGAPLRRFVAYGLGAADRIVFPSKEMLEAQHAALFPNGESVAGAPVMAKSVAVPHGVPRYFDASDGGGGPPTRRDGWLLWPVSVERGLDALLRVVPRLRESVRRRGGDFRLFVCHHRGGYHGALPGVGALPEDVVFTGMLPPRRLASMLRSCAVFAFPSAVPEAFSLSAWECAAHGVVPVVYGLGALKALGGVGCPVLPPGDLEGLADAAAKLLGDPAAARVTRRRILAATRANVRDWDATAATWATTALC